MRTLLITAIGGDIAQAAATIVRKAYPDWTLVGTDVATRHGGSLFVDRLLPALPASDAGYVEWLEGLAERCAADYCLPLSEAELGVLAIRSGDRVGPARLLWAGARAVKVGCDKLGTAGFLKEIGIPAPWTVAAEDEDRVPEYPCFFKLRRSAGSKAVFVCRSPEDVRFLRQRYPAAVLQEYLPDDEREVTCAVFRSGRGEIAVLPMLRRLVGGFTGWAEIIDDREIEAQCRQIAESLDLVGSINVQLRLTKAGPRIFEINPRLSSTLLMRHLAGFSDLIWMIEEAEGRFARIKYLAAGTVLVRTQGAAILPAVSKGGIQDGN